MPRAAVSRLRAGLCAALVAALLAACTTTVVDGKGSTSGSLNGAAPATSSTLKWSGCGGIDLGSTSASTRFEVQCARLAVPLDYQEPNGRKISIALVRLHRKDASAKASLLTDPGGPGASGVQFAVGEAGSLPKALTSHYDLIGFDPRGVGSSSPVQCLTDRQDDRYYATDFDIRTSQGFNAAKAAARSVAKACEAKYGRSLDDFDTVATVRDMDRIRRALEQPRLDYLGFSYGTELGALYAHLYPSRVGAMVLDGAVDPLKDAIRSSTDQMEGFEKSFDQFAAWCRQRSPCDSLGDPRKAVYRLMARAVASPLHSSDPNETRVLTRPLLLLGVLLSLYSKSFWPYLAEGLIQAEQGDARILMLLADQYTQRDRRGHYSNFTEAILTINCNDTPRGPSDAQIRALTASWVKRFPMFGLWSASSLFACQQWQPNRTVPPKPTAPRAANTILVVGNLHDPATPYQGAQDLTKTLGKARLLTWDGEGHTSYTQGSSCVDDLVTSYLVANRLPPQGKTCPR